MPIESRHRFGLWRGFGYTRRTTGRHPDDAAITVRTATTGCQTPRCGNDHRLIARGFDGNGAQASAPLVGSARARTDSTAATLRGRHRHARSPRRGLPRAPNRQKTCT